jgi:hypothetical protein
MSMVLTSEGSCIQDLVELAGWHSNKKAGMCLPEVGHAHLEASISVTPQAQDSINCHL